MADIGKSVRAYEDWMGKQLKREIVKKDIALKHKKMGESPFVFLRASYWRWAETILEICPDLAAATPVLAVGDIHLENFGTWRDVDGRLVWGVNDFDEAAQMPYALDLVRLATSALLASPGRGPTAAAMCAAILEGYRQGLDAPRPILLDRDWAWLRQLLAVSDKERAKFWSKIETARHAPAPAPYRRALAEAMPQARLDMWTARRTAGTGSLGRPRWIGVADWHGAPVVRELKVVLVSAWALARGSGTQAIRCGEIANGRHRAKDPWYRLQDNVILRRLSPNNRKVEAEKEGVWLLTPDMLRAMGLDLANVHLGTSSRREAIVRDLEGRKGDWLRANAKRAAAAVVRDCEEWKAA
jgi:Ser/Thr protein kinase RdoA (MazF antagonist)